MHNYLCLFLLSFTCLRVEGSNGFSSRVKGHTWLFEFSQHQCSMGQFSESRGQILNLTRNLDTTTCPQSVGVSFLPSSPDSWDVPFRVSSIRADPAIIHGISDAFSIELWLSDDPNYYPIHGVPGPILSIGESSKMNSPFVAKCEMTQNFLLRGTADYLSVQVRKSASFCETAIASSSITSSRVTHVVVGFGDNMVTVYVDGVPETIALGSIAFDASSWNAWSYLNLGSVVRMTNGWSPTWVGTVFMAAMYSRVLTLSEVITNRDAFLPPSAPTATNIAVTTDEDVPVIVSLSWYDFDNEHSSQNKFWDDLSDGISIFITSLPSHGRVFISSSLIEITAADLPVLLPNDFSSISYQPPLNAFSSPPGSVFSQFQYAVTDAPDYIAMSAVMEALGLPPVTQARGTRAYAEDVYGGVSIGSVSIILEAANDPPCALTPLMSTIKVSFRSEWRKDLGGGQDDSTAGLLLLTLTGKDIDAQEPDEIAGFILTSLPIYGQLLLFIEDTMQSVVGRPLQLSDLYAYDSAGSPALGLRIKHHLWYNFTAHDACPVSDGSWSNFHDDIVNFDEFSYVAVDKHGADSFSWTPAVFAPNSVDPNIGGEDQCVNEAIASIKILREAIVNDTLDDVKIRAEESSTLAFALSELVNFPGVSFFVAPYYHVVGYLIVSLPLNGTISASIENSHSNVQRAEVSACSIVSPSLSLWYTPSMAYFNRYPVDSMSTPAFNRPLDFFTYRPLLACREYKRPAEPYFTTDANFISPSYFTHLNGTCDLGSLNLHKATGSFFDAESDIMIEVLGFNHAPNFTVTPVSTWVDDFGDFSVDASYAMSFNSELTFGLDLEDDGFALRPLFVNVSSTSGLLSLNLAALSVINMNESSLPRYLVGNGIDDRTVAFEAQLDIVKILLDKIVYVPSYRSSDFITITLIDSAPLMYSAQFSSALSPVNPESGVGLSGSGTIDFPWRLERRVFVHVTSASNKFGFSNPISYVVPVLVLLLLGCTLHCCRRELKSLFSCCYRCYLSSRPRDSGSTHKEKLQDTKVESSSAAADRRDGVIMKMLKYLVRRTIVPTVLCIMRFTGGRDKQIDEVTLSTPQQRV